MLRLITCAILWWFGLTTVSGQESCQEKLLNAINLYESGQLLEAENIAKSCVKSDEVRDQWQAYRILSLVYLSDNRMDDARTAAESMLNIYPSYVSNSFQDPAEFIKLLNSIIVIPRFSVGAAQLLGLNSTIPNVPKSYVLGDYSKKYTGQIGVQFSSRFGFYLSPSWALNLGIGVTEKKYKIDYQPANWDINVSENLKYLDIPLNVEYVFRPTVPWRFFAQSGLVAGYLLYDNNTFTATDIRNQEVFELNKLDALDRRNRWNLGIQFGVGIYRKLGQGLISLKADYSYSLNKINKNGTRYNNLDQMFTYYYVDDDLLLNSSSLSIGYTHFVSYKVFNKSKGKK